MLGMIIWQGSSVRRLCFLVVQYDIKRYSFIPAARIASLGRKHTLQDNNQHFEVPHDPTTSGTTFADWSGPWQTAMQVHI
jgi:hypothetical protein